MQLSPNILLILFFTICCWQCSKQVYTAQNLPESYLSFGNGGGFTGATTTFLLTENGQIFKIESLRKDTNEIGQVSKKMARSLYEQFTNELSL